jgi:hypothetical protein
VRGLDLMLSFSWIVFSVIPHLMRNPELLSIISGRRESISHFVIPARRESFLARIPDPE